MIREDYLLRLIEQFARAVAQISGFRKAGQYPQALEAIQRAYGQLLGVDAKLVRLLSEPDLIGFLKTGGEPDPSKCAIAAELLCEEAEVHELQGKPEESRLRRRKALHLLLTAFLQEGEMAFPDLRERIERLGTKVGDEKRTPEIRAMLEQYREKTNRGRQNST